LPIVPPDIHIHDVNDPAMVLGGLILTNGVSNANLYSIVDIICIFDTSFFLRDDSGLEIQHALQPGNYYIRTSGRFISRFIVDR
jgi:hypothetical protein